MSASYDQARRDFEYLESLVELDDQVELDAERLALMRDPTLARAAKMYEDGIRLWLAQQHGSNLTRRARAIAERY